jgi:hypothetical protein
VTGPNTWKEHTSKTVQLTSGKKRIFVISNAEKRDSIRKKLESIKEGITTLDQFYEIVYPLGKINAQGLENIDRLKELINSTDGYVMSNSLSNTSLFDLQGGIGFDESRTGGADKNNFRIDVQRAVAKVSVLLKDEDVLKTLDKVGVLKNPKYTIRNVNSSVYLFQKFASDNVDPGVITNIPRSPFYSLPEKSHYDSIYYKGFNFVDMGTATNAPKVYVTENTSENPRNATVTYAAVQAAFLPRKEMIVESFSYNELTHAFSAVKSPAAELTNATTLYRLVRIGNSTGLAANVYFTNKDKAYEAAYYIKYNKKEGFDSSKYDELNWDGTNGYIVEYNGGLSYYRLDIGANINDAMTVGIRRNHAYAASITSFSGIGEPKLEDLDRDPDKPIGQKTHVTATIHITNWTDVSTDHKL